MVLEDVSIIISQSYFIKHLCFVVIRNCYLSDAPIFFRSEKSMPLCQLDSKLYILWTVFAKKFTIP